MSKNRTKVKKDYSIFYWVAFCITSAIFYLVGYTSNRPKEKELKYTNFYTDDTHYIVFEGESGTSVVNYTLDSIKKESIAPKIIFRSK